MALMKKIFIHITEFQNWINDVPVGFCVVDDLYRIRDLPPGKTQQVKVDPIIRCCKRNEYEWNIGVFLDGNFTGLEISPLDVIVYARLIFRHENKDGTNVLVVEGIREEKSDYLLRLKFFGFMRNMYWDKRPSVVIARSDSKHATKLRMIEAHDPVQKMDLFAGIPLPKRQTESPLSEVYKHGEKALKVNGKEGKTKTTNHTIKKEKIALPPPPPPPEKPPRQRSTSVVNRGANVTANISSKRVYEYHRGMMEAHYPNQKMDLFVGIPLPKRQTESPVKEGYEHWEKALKEYGKDGKTKTANHTIKKEKIVLPPPPPSLPPEKPPGQRSTSVVNRSASANANISPKRVYEYHRGMFEAHDPVQKMDLFAGITLPKRQTESPLKEGYQHWEKEMNENGEKGKTKTTDRTIKKEKIALPPQPPPPEKPPRQRSTSVVNRGASANANISPHLQWMMFGGREGKGRQTESPLKEGYQHREKAVKENGEKGKTKTTYRTIKKEKIVLPPQPPPPEKPPSQRSTSVVNRGASANANISPKRVYERNQSSSTTSEFRDVPHAPPTFRIVTNSIITNSMDSFDHAILFVLAMTLVVLVSVSFG